MNQKIFVIFTGILILSLALNPDYAYGNGGVIIGIIGAIISAVGTAVSIGTATVSEDERKPEILEGAFSITGDDDGIVVGDEFQIVFNGKFYPGMIGYDGVLTTSITVEGKELQKETKTTVKGGTEASYSITIDAEGREPGTVSVDLEQQVCGYTEDAINSDAGGVWDDFWDRNKEYCTAKKSFEKEIEVGLPHTAKEGTVSNQLPRHGDTVTGTFEVENLGNEKVLNGQIVLDTECNNTLDVPRQGQGGNPYTFECTITAGPEIHGTSPPQKFDYFEPLTISPVVVLKHGDPWVGPIEVYNNLKMTVLHDSLCCSTANYGFGEVDEFALDKPNYEGEAIALGFELSAEFEGAIFTVDFGDGQTEVLSENQFTHIYDDNGSYTLTLEATMGDESLGKELYSVDVYNVSPHIEISGEDSVMINKPYELSISVEDPGKMDNEIQVSVNWGNDNIQKINVENGDSATLSNTFSTSEFALIEVTASDKDSSTTLFHKLAILDKPPTVIISALTDSSEGEAITIDVSESFDLDNGIQGYLFDFGDGSTIATTVNSIEHVYHKSGTYDITVKALDLVGHTGETSTSINVQPVLPELNPIEILQNENGNVILSSELVDTQQDLVYEWDFGDGSTEIGSGVEHVFENGTYEISLTVTHPSGLSSTQTSTLEVTGAEIKETTCQPGTILQDGVCVDAGGGCLIATAAYGSEMAPQVQLLREIRDNTVLNTESGSLFMSGFNSFYYSFSPTIADWERENPVFKETVKLGLTPLLASLSILNHVDIDSEQEMLGYGISMIILNLGMYLMVPAIIIIGIKRKLT